MKEHRLKNVGGNVAFDFSLDFSFSISFPAWLRHKKTP